MEKRESFMEYKQHFKLWIVTYSNKNSGHCMPILRSYFMELNVRNKQGHSITVLCKWGGKLKAFKNLASKQHYCIL